MRRGGRGRGAAILTTGLAAGAGLLLPGSGGASRPGAPAAAPLPVVPPALPLFAAAPPPVSALVFSPDGMHVLSGGYGAVEVRSVTGAAGARRLPTGLSRIHDLVMAPDGRTLMAAGGTAGSAGLLQALAWPDGRSLWTARPHADLVTAAAFSPDGALLATASADRTVEVRSARSPGGALVAGEARYRLTGHAGPVLAAAFSPDGALLVTAGADRALKVWEAGTGALRQSHGNHTGIIHSLAFRPGEPGSQAPAQCASGSDDRTARVWQPRIGRMVRIVRGHAGAVLAVVYSRDGKVLFTAGTEGVIRAVDAESDRVLRSWPAHAGWVYSLAVSPDGKLLASGGGEGTVKLWNVETGRPASTP